MAAGRIRKWLTADWCFAGLILFFIVHGYSENQFLVPVRELILLLAILMAAGVIVYILFKRIFRNGHKATVFTTLVFFVVLFFGVVQDFLAQLRFLSSLTRLTILLPVCVVLLVIFFIWVKRTKLPFRRTVFFLNTLLLLYLIVDLSIITYRFISPTQNRDHALAQLSLTDCDTCARPPVFLLLFDSYYGSTGLKEYFNYDNSAFENSLRERGFYVNTATTSNYYYTLYSMASLLNMDYLYGIGSPVIKNHYGFTRATGSLRNNIVCRYFSSLGYRIYNYSGFDMPNVPAGYNSDLLPDKIQLITHKTLYYRVEKYLPTFLVRTGLVKEVGEDIEKEYIRNNEKMMVNTLGVYNRSLPVPTFTYMHVMMPHGPFVFDSLGNRTHIMQRYYSLSPDSLARMFLSYQVHTNKMIAHFITRLQEQTKGNAVILLMSDHGYQPAREKENKLAYYNLNAVYLPSGQYDGWYNGMSNVNQFRILFNTLFQQKLPLLRDSIVSK